MAEVIVEIGHDHNSIRIAETIVGDYHERTQYEESTGLGKSGGLRGQVRKQAVESLLQHPTTLSIYTFVVRCGVCCTPSTPA